MLEECELYGSFASFLLMSGNEDALGYEVVCRGAKRGTMVKFRDAVETGGGHLIG